MMENSLNSKTRIPAWPAILCLSLSLNLSGCEDSDPIPDNGGSVSPHIAVWTGPVPIGTNVSDDYSPGLMHYTSQGSGFFPMNIVRALTDSETGEPFLSHLDRFGLLPGAVAPENLQGLPTGLMSNTVTVAGRDIELLGFNCAACHTSNIHYNGEIIRVEGGAGLFHVDALCDAVAASLMTTLNNPDRLFDFLVKLETDSFRQSQKKPSILSRFQDLDELRSDGAFGTGLTEHLLDRAGRSLSALAETADTEPLKASRLTQIVTELLVQGHSEHSPLTALDESQKHSALFADLVRLEVTLADIQRHRRFLSSRSWLTEPGHRLTAGYGRMDSFGTARIQLFGSWNEKNRLPVNAPVSCPPLWNTDSYAWLHWNASTSSIIQRNIGESINAGATFDPGTQTTSVAIMNQMHLEEQVRKIQPPLWPADLLGAPQAAEVARGRELYATHCRKCHTPAGRNQRGLLVCNLLTLEESGTDPLSATNFERPVYRNDGSSVSFSRALGELLGALQATRKKKHGCGLRRTDGTARRTTPASPVA
ncbi:MAG: di-heme-cytochrome C peroxidase [Planctomycetaceae bacterium]